MTQRFLMGSNHLPGAIYFSKRTPMMKAPAVVVLYWGGGYFNKMGVLSLKGTGQGSLGMSEFAEA